MAVRWYLATVLDPVPASAPDAADALPYRPASDDVLRSGVVAPPYASSNVIPTHAVTGAPLFNWSLVIIDAGDHTALLADNRLFALPDMLLDAALSTQPGNIRNALLNRLSAQGVDTTGLSQTSTLRQVIQRVFDHFGAGTFDESRARARAN